MRFLIEFESKMELDAFCAGAEIQAPQSVLLKNCMGQSVVAVGRAGDEGELIVEIHQRGKKVDERQVVLGPDQPFKIL